ncbi:MAG: isopenicillin N synthase family dioxygenase [Granulosicoccus sp.]
MSTSTPALDATDDQRALTLDKLQLPVIDLGALREDDESARKHIAMQLGDAARNSGFFYVEGHGISDELIDRIFKASQQFHSQSRSYKMKYWSGFTTHHRGYVPFEENGSDFPKTINFYEAFDLSFEAPNDHPDYIAKWRMTGPNVWPELAGWKETVEEYYQSVFDLGVLLIETLASELGVEPDTLTRHINYPTSQLRMLRYIENDLPASNDVVGIDAHSDFECFTILLQGGPGLQVMNADDFWIEAPPLPGCFIVNIGDIFETWSGGQFKSTQHRVVNTGKERYSFPLFFGLDYHTVVEPLPPFRTPEVLEKYPPIKAGEHLMRMSIKTFRYMNEAYERGELSLGVDLPEQSPFKRTAKSVDSIESVVEAPV